MAMHKLQLHAASAHVKLKRANCIAHVLKAEQVLAPDARGQVHSHFDQRFRESPAWLDWHCPAELDNCKRGLTGRSLILAWGSQEAW